MQRTQRMQRMKRDTEDAEGLCEEPAAPLAQLYFSKNLSVSLCVLRALCVEKRK